MNVADWVSVLFCLALPLAMMLMVIALLTWTRKELVSMVRAWLGGK